MFITIAAILVILVLGGYLLMNGLVLLIDFIEARKKGKTPIRGRSFFRASRQG